MGGGKGGADVEYSQSPEQQAVYRALQPMIQRLGGLYAPTIARQPGIPSVTTQPSFRIEKAKPGEGLIRGTFPIIEDGGLAGFKYGMESIAPTVEEVLAKAAQKPESGLARALSLAPISAPTVMPTTLQPTAATYPTFGGAGLYNIPHPAGAVSTVSPLVSPGLWKPYQQAEERLMDIYQSRGQLGAPGAGLSGAAATGLGEFYSQAAKDIGLQTYQMGMPLWQAQLQREMMPWQMLPGLLGGTYPTGIAQEGTNWGGALAGGLGGAAAGMALAPATGGLSVAIPALMGAAGFMGGK